MHRLVPLILVVLTFCVAIATAVALVEGPASCKYCGMDRTKFAQSRMLVDYDDGSATGTCSIHCLAVELANTIDKTPKAIKVGDHATKQLIDAESAVWVIGGDQQGVMSRNAKWAFATPAAAEAFVKQHQGRIGTFDDAIRAAYEDMYADTKMIRDRRKMKRMKQAEQK
jgi:nitrous oxide reductase accessory protein NosL